jgi:hypothetical protein
MVFQGTLTVTPKIGIEKDNPNIMSVKIFFAIFNFFI